MKLQYKLWKRWKGLKTSTSISALFASIEKGYLLQSSVVFLILCSIQNFCKSKKVSFCSKSRSSALKSIIFLVNTFWTSVVANEPLFRKNKNIYAFHKHNLRRYTNIQMQQRQVKHLHPHYTTFRDFRDETDTFQHVCNVIDPSCLFVYS